MSTKIFLFQGLTEHSHDAALTATFKVPGLSEAWLSVAFVTRGGVEIAKAAIGPHAAKTTVFAGIRNGITTVQGMKALLDLGVRLYAVDTGKSSLLFHPKIYAAVGPDEGRLLVGSANFTPGGLRHNFEASLLIGLNLAAADDLALLDSVKGALAGLVSDHPDNVSEITDEAGLDELLAEGRLWDEKVNRPTSPKSSSTVSETYGDAIPVMKFRGRIKRSKAKTSPVKGPIKAVAPPVYVAPAHAVYEEVWRMDDLKRRDLGLRGPGRKPGAKTNPTGSINLDKGALPDDVDFQTYFRENVFSALAWDMKPNGIETSLAHFRLVTKGIDRGDFVLTVRHSTRAAASRAQNNALSRLSWGAAKPYFADPSLIGRSLTLSRDAEDPHRFRLDID